MQTAAESRRYFPLHEYKDRWSRTWNEIVRRGYDAALICTDHDDVDYAALVEALPLVVDTRNATRALRGHYNNIVMA